MTVAELIEKLKAVQHQSALVLTTDRDEEWVEADTVEELTLREAKGPIPGLYKRENRWGEEYDEKFMKPDSIPAVYITYG